MTTPTPGTELKSHVESIVAALIGAEFDPQHAGELFLRQAAKDAIAEALGSPYRVLVSGLGGRPLAGARLFNASVAPDLAVVSASKVSNARGPATANLFGATSPTHADMSVSDAIAVCLVVLRQDQRAAINVLADAVLLATEYEAVVVFILDRRVSKREPFGASALMEADHDAPSRNPSDLAAHDQQVLATLWLTQRIRIAVRRQDPFGF